MARFLVTINGDTEDFVEDLANHLTMDELVDFVLELDARVADLEFTRRVMELFGEIYDEETRPEGRGDEEATFRTGDRVRIKSGTDSSYAGRMGEVFALDYTAGCHVKLDSGERIHFLANELEKIELRIGASVKHKRLDYTGEVLWISIAGRSITVRTDDDTHVSGLTDSFEVIC